MKIINTTEDYIKHIEQDNTLAAVLFTQAQVSCSRCNLAKHAIKSIKTSVPVFEMPTTMDMYPANALGIKTVPTLVIFKNGQEVASMSGTSPELYKKEYKNMLHPNY